MCTCFVPGMILNLLFSFNHDNSEWEEIAIGSYMPNLPIVSQVLALLSGRSKKSGYVSVPGISYEGDR